MVKVRDIELKKAWFLSSEQFISEPVSLLIISAILQAQAECILMNSYTDYSGKTCLECHISIGKLTTKEAFLHLFANKLTNLDHKKYYLG